MFDTTALRTDGEAFPVAGPVTSSAALGATALHLPDFTATPSALVYRSMGRGAPGQAFSLISTSDATKTTRPVGLVVVKNWMTALAQAH